MWHKKLHLKKKAQTHDARLEDPSLLHYPKPSTPEQFLTIGLSKERGLCLGPQSSVLQSQDGSPYEDIASKPCRPQTATEIMQLPRFKIHASNQLWRENSWGKSHLN